MDYSKLAEAYEEMSSSSSRLKKTEIMVRLLKEASDAELPEVAMLLQGNVFPSWDESEMGIAGQLIAKAIANATGFSEAEISKKFKKLGDFGEIAEDLMKSKKQRTLFNRRLTVAKVFENLRALASTEGKGSQERKFSLVSELIGSATPLESKYIVRTVISDLRIGVAEGVVRDAVAQAFLPHETKEQAKESVEALEAAWFVSPDYGELARIAKHKGVKGLREIKLEVGRPYFVLLAEKAPSLKDAIDSFPRVAMEYKFDGARLIIHKKGEKIWLFTRRLENVTKQFPEVVEMARKAIEPRDCIVEGEMLGIDKKTGKPLPFQQLSQRIKRKYDIEMMAKEMPVQVNLFDITLINGKCLFDQTLEQRRRMLEDSIKNIKDKFQIAKQLVTKDLDQAQKFYEEALGAGQEGLIVKNLDAIYQPGRRVAGGWLKVKPTMENLDLVITGGTWGTGKRTGWMGSFLLGCKDKDDFKDCGMIGTGVKEKVEMGVSFEELTNLLKPLITTESGSEIRVKPKIVVEVAYEEIQKSPTYSSGYALRFPRVKTIRVDKSPAEASTLHQLEKLYDQQRGRGKA